MAEATPVSTSAPKKKTSPWVWGAIGCGSLLALCALVLLIGALFVGRKVKDFARDAEQSPAVAAARMIVRMNPDLEEVASDASAGTVTIRNKKTGEVMTMNAADIEQGRISFADGDGREMVVEGSGEGDTGRLRMQTAEGTFEMQAGEGDMPTWVPAYPGAADSQAWSMQGPDGAAGGMTFRVTDKVASVIEHYETTLRDAGFEVSTSTFQQDGRTQGGMLNAVHEGDKRHVSVLLAAEDDGVQVTVSYGPQS